MSKKRMSRKERLERREWQVMKGQQRVRALQRSLEILNRLVTVDEVGCIVRGEERIDLFDLGVALVSVEEALKTYEQDEQESN